MIKKDTKIPWLFRIPPSLLSKSIYAWFPIVAFFTWPPVLSGLIAVYPLVNLALLREQHNWWRRQIMNNTMDTGDFVYEEHFSPSMQALLTNDIILIIGGIVLGIMLAGQITLSGVQWFLLTAGFVLVQQLLLLVWVPTTYLVTEDAVWILSAETQQFVWYGEVAEVQIGHDQHLDFESTGLPIPFNVPNIVTFTPFDSENPVWDSETFCLALADTERFTQFFLEERIRITT